MLLKDLLYKVSITSRVGDVNIEVEGISFNSESIRKNHLFVAVRGTKTDGHHYILSAIGKGATVIVCEELPENLPEGITYITVAESTAALGIMSTNFYGDPSNKLVLTGVTGTNGKTTTVTLLYQLFRSLGYNAGLISTIKIMINDDEYPVTHTTPDAITLNRLLADMVQQGVTHCFMEVSSHAIIQHRVTGLHYKIAVFTNISHDHLDYHKNFENYINAKKKLFDGLSSSSIALTNIDDKRGTIMLQNTKAEKVTYAFKNMADFKGRVISNTLEGLELEIQGREVWCRLVGDFNSYNILCAYAVAVKLHEDEEHILTALSAIEGVRGRFELVKVNSNITGIVDYAHTPDALENVLLTIGAIRTGNEQVITVVGCGGNRDKEKRPIMTEIACKLSTKVIVTSDNPRDEEPEEIINDMLRGLDPVNEKKVLRITDRKEAIKTACMMSSKSDIILVAGKGHETYQEIKGVKYDFDDREVLSSMLKLYSN